MKSRTGSAGLLFYFDAISAERARFPVTAAGFRTEPVWIQTQKREIQERLRDLLETGQLPFYGISSLDKVLKYQNRAECDVLDE